MSMLVGLAERQVMKKLMRGKLWFAVYEGEGAGDGAGTGAGDGAGTGAGAATGAAATGAAVTDKKFSQDDLNKFLADDRRKHQQQVRDAVTQLEELKKQKGLSDQARSDLEQRIDSLNQSLMTEQEKAKLELKKKETEFKSVLDSTAKEREEWKSRYSSEMITNHILLASKKHGAVSEQQMLKLLRPETRLVEVLSADGKTVTGFVPKVKMTFKDDTTGEEKELDLTVEDAVKRMKDLPDQFGNLFSSGVKGGLGGSGSTGQGDGADMGRILKDPEAYRKNRARFGLGRRK